MIRSLLTGLLAALAVFGCAPAQTAGPDRAARWEKDVAAIEKRLKKDPPDAGGVAFVGSSSIRLWDVGKSFPDCTATNVGFGGSQIPDQTHFVPRLVLPLEPRAIVFYAGDNDIAAGRDPKAVRDDFAEFAARVHAELPKTHILFVAIKPSIARWKQFGRQAEANALVKAVCAGDERLAYVDVVTPMLGSDGKLDPDLFVKDGLHLSAKGYAVWTKAVNEAAR
ncbi:MAG TPA: GDSL-type esterase/lipase family protein [Fimbriiglobus sp.]|jgi:lysophospholipase L1-like esterase|nr:GDSL-type esterase/lipase family protein [Fimbriiglobus sp.]